jgi:uncharacterized membrane protein
MLINTSSEWLSVMGLATAFMLAAPIVWLVSLVIWLVVIAAILQLVNANG